jgi:hypothetical protein
LFHLDLSVGGSVGSCELFLVTPWVTYQEKKPHGQVDTRNQQKPDLRGGQCYLGWFNLHGLFLLGGWLSFSVTLSVTFGLFIPGFQIESKGRGQEEARHQQKHDFHVRHSSPGFASFDLDGV